MTIVAKMGAIKEMGSIAIRHFREVCESCLDTPSNLHGHELTSPAFRKNKNVAKLDSDEGL